VLGELGKQSVDRQPKAKVIMGAMLDLAVMEGALQVNLVRGSLSISRPQALQAAPTVESTVVVDERATA
jgi:hypothetical protein